MGRRVADSGVTLIELLVSMSLGVLVLILVGGMFVGTFKAQSSVRSAAEASNSGQLVSKSLTRDARGAREITTIPPSTGTCLLRLTVVDNALTTPVSTHFVAWYFGNGEIRSTRSTLPIAVPASPTAVGSWTLLAGGVRQVGATPVFSTNGATVDLHFQVVGAAGAPVLIETTVASRQPMPTPSPGVSTPCS